VLLEPPAGCDLRSPEGTLFRQGGESQPPRGLGSGPANRWKVEGGARHGVPLRGFHTFSQEAEGAEPRSAGEEFFRVQLAKISQLQRFISPVLSRQSYRRQTCFAPNDASLSRRYRVPLELRDFGRLDHTRGPAADESWGRQ
jgi:hypothetical protein